MNNNFSDDDEDILMMKMFAENKPADKKDYEEFAAPFSEIEKNEDLLEIPALQNTAENSEFAAEPTNLDPLIETPSENFAPSPLETPFIEPSAANFEKATIESGSDDAPIFQNHFQPESPDETIRKSGLAYSAAIILLGSIVFTLILGWFADLLFGTSPWGKVGGIILGAVIGFIQFFRTTSQILKDKE